MKTILTSLIIFTFSTAFAQKWVDLANVYWNTSPANAADSTNSKWNLNTFAIDLKAPVVLNDDNVLLFGLAHQQNVITDNVNLNGDNSLKFSSSMIQIGWEHKWNAKSKMLFMSMTRLNTDFKFVDLSHFQQGAVALGTTSRSEKFDWKYGLYYNAEFFGPMFVPLFGFNWAINEKWRLKMVIPVNLELSYMPSDKFRTGLRFDGVNASYRTNLNTNLNWIDGYHIDKADNNAWAFAEFNLGKNVWIHAKAGYSIIRKYRIYEDSDQMNVKFGPVNVGDDRVETNRMFKNGLNFEARFIYRLPLD